MKKHKLSPAAKKTAEIFKDTPLSENKTYNEDLDLFEKLSLKPFKNLPLFEKHHLGKISQGESSTDIWVSAMPAQFWFFKISAKEGDEETIYEVSTGSGSLTDFWHAIEAMMGNMIAVESVKKIKHR